MSEFQRFSAVYAICAGICIPSLWVYFLLSRTFPELGDQPTAVAFLLTAELLTAAVSLASGIGMLLRKAWSSRVWYLAIGMILYAVIMATGQFAQSGSLLFSAVFALLTAATATMAIVSVVGKNPTSYQ